MGLIDYPPRVDFWNCITHALGAVLSAVALIAMLIKADGARAAFSALIYGLAMVSVFTVSAVYHGLKNGETKRKTRILDHSTVPLLIAGTATPCALLTLYEVSRGHSILVFVLAWLCTLFGVVSKVFFFEKLKAVTMAVYIVSGFIMLLSVVPLLGEIDTAAFKELVIGCVFYVIGAVLCGLGKKRPWLHVIFHVFVLIGSAVHFYVIYSYVL